MAPSENAAAAVAVAQFAPGDDTAANLAEITRLAELAVARGAGVGAALQGTASHGLALTLPPP